MLEIILLGMLSAFGYDLFKEIFLSNDQNLTVKVEHAFNEAIKIFHAKYGDIYGKPDNNFLANKNNLEKLIESFQLGNNTLQASVISNEGFDDSTRPPSEVVEDFINIFYAQAQNDHDLFTRISFATLKEKIDELTGKRTKSRLITIEEIKTKYPLKPVEITDDYLSRTALIQSSAISKEARFLRYTDSKKITEIIGSENRIVLLADAGNGKTTEIQKLYLHYSEKESEYYPVIIRLNLYTNEKIEDLLPPYWEEIAEKYLLIMMDGLDEIRSNERLNAIRAIEKFSENHIECKIIITCRTNFYNSANENYSGTLKGFIVFYLNRLTWEDITSYVKEKLGKEENLFFELVNKNKSMEILDIPFYLKFLVKEFSENHYLPSSRKNIYDKLIDNSIKLDEEHTRTISTEDIFERKKIVLASLEKLAIIMEVLCRNHISNDEYHNIINDTHARTILKQTGLWEYKNDNWQFQHNTFQEYLASKTICNLPINKIKKILAFPPTYNKIIPSWANTLSFLLNNYRNDDLKNWILNQQPELIVKCEPDRLQSPLRRKIFRMIFNNYKKKKIWIDRDKYNLFELAKFGECDDSINFLLKHITIDEYYTTVGNAINLLVSMRIPYEKLAAIRNILLKVALHYNNVVIQNDSIIALGIIGLVDRHTIDILFSTLGSSDNDWIRYAMYFILEQSAFLDEFVDYFLDGIKFYSDRFSNGEKDSRIGNEFWHLESGLKKVVGSDALIKILSYFLNNPSVVHIIGFDRVIPEIMSNAAKIYNKTKHLQIFETICELYILLHLNYSVKEAQFCLTFYDNSNTRLQAFYNIYNRKDKIKSHALFKILGHLSDKNCFEFIIAEYRQNNISDQDIWWYQVNLFGELHGLFNNRINDLTNNKFVLKPRKDYRQERENQLKRDIKLLYNKKALLEEVKFIFTSENVTTIDKELIDTIRYKRYDQPPLYSNISIRLLNDLVENGNKDFDMVRLEIEKMDWGYYSSVEIFNNMMNSKDFMLDDVIRIQLENWCKAQINRVDFRHAIKQERTTTTANQLAVLLHYFLRMYKFSCPKEVLLDLISFDWYGAGIDYLEDFLSIEEITTRILSNLEEENHNDTELRNYFNFCLKHEIKSAKKFAIKEILNINRELEIRRLSLELVNKLTKNSNQLLTLLRKINDSFKWELVELLVKKNNLGIRDYLLEKLKRGTEEDQIAASNNLMRMDDLEGLKFYTEKLEKEKRFFHEWHRQHPITFIKDPKAIKYLLRLLKLTYDKDMQEDRFDSLYNKVESVLTNIALASEDNFKKVYSSILRFIATYRMRNNRINFLYTYLERLERQFYFSKIKNISLTDSLAKLKLIGLFKNTSRMN